MTNFKRCGTAIALLMASSFPALAQEEGTETTVVEMPAGLTAPAGSIILQFAGEDELYVVTYEAAAELCGLDPVSFEGLAEAPQTEVIVCSEFDRALLEQDMSEGDVTALVDYDDSDDDDDDGDFGDDQQETEDDEENDEDGDGIFDEDDNDQDDDDGLINDDDAGTDDDAGDDDATDGGDDAVDDDDSTEDDSDGEDTSDDNDEEDGSVDG